MRMRLAPVPGLRVVAFHVVTASPARHPPSPPPWPDIRRASRHKCLDLGLPHRIPIGRGSMTPTAADLGDGRGGLGAPVTMGAEAGGDGATLRSLGEDATNLE